MAELSPEAAKILDARKAAAVELQAIDGTVRQISDPNVIRLANARLYEAAIMLRVLNGDSITAAEIKASQDMVEAAREAVGSTKPIEAKLVIMHKTYDPNPAKPPAPEPSTPKLLPPPVIEGEIVTGAPSPEQASTPTADVPAASAAPVYPRRDPSKLGIHDAPLPNGQPARMRRNDYIAINAGGACSTLEKAPDWSAAHPLPSPPPERLK